MVNLIKKICFIMLGLRQESIKRKEKRNNLYNIKQIKTINKEQIQANKKKKSVNQED